MFLIAQVAMTEYHRLDGLNNRNLFLHTSGNLSSHIKGYETGLCQFCSLVLIGSQLSPLLSSLSVFPRRELPCPVLFPPVLLDKGPNVWHHFTLKFYP